MKEFTYFVTQYGVAPSTRMKIVEIPDDTVPTAWAPEIAALSSRAITEKTNYRLLANTIAHQWWGVSVSPASKDDRWISDGFSRYSEAVSYTHLLLDTKVEVTSPAVPKRPAGPGRIEFDHVWFAYNVPGQAGGATGQSPVTTQTTEPDWVLRDVNFAIEPGDTVAVVGHTGAGKTTLISLLMRFYDVQRGAIRIDGVDIKDMNLDELRGRFGVVLQDPFLFSGTVGGNIRLGTARIQDRDVEQAAEDVNLAEFIRTLPGGFKEEVRERGSTLSTGQKQLISFARALAHNPNILILDEATSSVDTETEFRVRDALGRMVEGLSLIHI